MKLTAITCLVALACVAGCTTETAKLHPEENPYLSQGRIQFESSAVKHTIQVVRVDTTRVGAGLLKLTLTLRNTTKSNLWADIRTTFLDERGHVLEQTNWESVELNARTVTEYSCTSLGSQAADYQVIIRKPAKTSFNLP